MFRRFAFAALSTLAVLAFAAVAVAQDGQDGAPLIVFADIVQGHETAEEGWSCTPSNRFQREDHLVWRAKVVDPATGEEMADDALESVTVVLPDGQELEMEYGEHPPREPVDAYWTIDWIVPADYPTGVVDYTIEAAGADGRSGKFVMFPIESSMLTILE